MRRPKQLYLPNFEALGVREFGGSLLKGNPRESRPISTRRPMHVVMRSSLATGERSLLRASRARKIDSLIRRIGAERGVKVYRFANSGNHLHLVVLPKSRQALRAFLRAISGVIARIVLGAERGKARGLKFWDCRPYTKILEWGREFSIVSRYLHQNVLEAIGFIPYRERKNRPGKRVTFKTARARGSPG